MNNDKVAPDSEHTKKLMAAASNPPTENEIVSIVASRISDQVDFDLLNELLANCSHENHSTEA